MRCACSRQRGSAIRTAVCATVRSPSGYPYPYAHFPCPYAHYPCPYARTRAAAATGVYDVCRACSARGYDGRRPGAVCSAGSSALRQSWRRAGSLAATNCEYLGVPNCTVKCPDAGMEAHAAPPACFSMRAAMCCRRRATGRVCVRVWVCARVSESDFACARAMCVRVCVRTHA
jgi:hypothetical protein